MKIYPKYYYPSVYHVPYGRLFEEGYRGIIFDIDNTLVPYDQAKPTGEVRKLISLLQEKGFSIILVSNNNRRRVRFFAVGVKLKSIFSAMKPLPFGLKKGLGILGTLPEQTLIIGDQLFTDVIAGNLLGVTTVLVPPIQEKEALYTKVKRGLEKKLLEYAKVQYNKN